MIGDEKQYDFACSAQIAANAQMTDAFRIYIQTLTGIVGGSIWLALQLKSSATIWGEPASLSLGIMAALLESYLYLTCSLIILRSMFAHDKYKKIELKLGVAADQQPPSFEPRIAHRIKFYMWVEIFILTVMTSITVAFWLFNPFWVLSAA